MVRLGPVILYGAIATTAATMIFALGFNSAYGTTADAVRKERLPAVVNRSEVTGTLEEILKRHGLSESIGPFSITDVNKRYDDIDGALASDCSQRNFADTYLCQEYGKIQEMGTKAEAQKIANVSRSWPYKVGSIYYTWSPLILFATAMVMCGRIVLMSKEANAWKELWNDVLWWRRNDPTTRLD